VAVNAPKRRHLQVQARQNVRKVWFSRLFSQAKRADECGRLPGSLSLCSKGGPTAS